MPEAVSNIAAFVPGAAVTTGGGPSLQRGPATGHSASHILSDPLRAFPSSDDAEKGVLSCFLQNPVDLLNDAHVKPLREHVAEAVDAIQEMLQHPGMLRGLSTGYGLLDKMTNGLQKSEMFVIAARPSMGKTSLAMNIVEHVAVVQQKPVAVFSL